jgi:hypothetical protein
MECLSRIEDFSFNIPRSYSQTPGGGYQELELNQELGKVQMKKMRYNISYNDIIKNPKAPWWMPIIKASISTAATRSKSGIEAS